MTKSEFLDGLCRGLRFHADPSEIQRMVDFYSQSIDDRVEDGMTEEEAVAAMGDIDYIVSEAKNAWEREASGSAHKAGVEKLVFRSSEVQSLSINDTSGDVRVLPSPDGDIHVEYENTSKWRYEAELVGSELTIRRVRTGSADGSVDVNVFGKKFSVTLPNMGGLFESNMRLTVKLPAGTCINTSVNIASGSVKVSDTNVRALYVKSASGDISVENVTGEGKVSLITASGDIDVSSLTSPELTASTVSGDVDMKGLNCAAFGVKTVSGDMELSDINCTQRVNLYSVSGDTDIKLAIPCAELNAETVSGDVSVELPGFESLYTVNVRTRSGDANINGAACAGPNTVSVRSVSGDVDIDFSR